jgi:molybdopterin converting factor small subunit
VNVDLEIFGQLLPGVPRRQTLALEGPTTVGEIAHRLDLKPEQIGLISINGVQSELEDQVSTDCRLCFFPPVSGG